MNIQVIGVPTFAGALYSGTELTPTALRQAGLVEGLTTAGHCVHDAGDVALPPYLPKHNVGPVRNWPAPRLVWEAVYERVRFDDAFPLILGGDCSLIVGTASRLQTQYGDRAHLLVLDGHLDTIRPQADLCVGAAGMGLWFLTCDAHMWWGRESFAPERITVFGCQQEPPETHGIAVTTLDQLRTYGLEATAHAYLQSLPSDARVLLHFDVDALHRDVMPVAYAPSEVGLTRTECLTLLRILLTDERVIGLEVTEFSALHDREGIHARALVELLAEALPTR